MANFKVRVNPSKCIGAGQCVLSAPAVFDQDDDGLVVLLDPEPPPAQHAAARKAADLCPARVISIEESTD